MPTFQTGTIFLKRLHRGENCGQMAVNSQACGFTVRRRCDDELLNQLPKEVEMPLDVILFACTGARDGRQRADGGVIY